MTVFKQAKKNLTLWYLAVIMVITLGFSLVVYVGTTGLATRALAIHEQRLANQSDRGGAFRMRPPEFQNPITKEAVTDLKTRTSILLASIDSLILIAAGGIGYFLAGKTLSPIEEMLDKQKRFVADAAHELKTPITATKTALEVSLRSKKLEAGDAKETMKEVAENMDSLHSLVNVLLKQSKYQSSLEGKHFETIKLKNITEEVINKLNPKAKEKNINIALTGENIQIRGDKKAITELVTILLDNAIKFSNKDIKVELGQILRHAQLKVTDQGIGISKTDLPYIFDRFYKADTARTKSNQDGFGLGLAIAKEIVTNHKGTITVGSKPKQGSIFTVKLPL